MNYLHHKAELLISTEARRVSWHAQTHTLNQRIRQVVTYLHLRQAACC